MPSVSTHVLLAKLGALRTELVEPAFVLDRRGSCAAADVAMTTAAQLTELCEEFSVVGTGSTSGKLTGALSATTSLVR